MALPDGLWKFKVRGTIVRGPSCPVVRAFDVIVESGVRGEASPHNLFGVGPIAHPDEAGEFRTHYLAHGAGAEIEAPETVSVFVRAAPGKWEPYVVRITAGQFTRLSKHECIIDLGPVAIHPDQEVYSK